MSKLLEMIRAGQVARNEKPRKPHTRSRQAVKPRFRVRVLVEQPAAKSPPPNARKIATLEWQFCKTECFLEVGDRLNTFYTVDEDYNGEASAHLVAKMWNYGLEPREIAVVLMRRYIRWLEAQENMPLAVTFEA